MTSEDLLCLAGLKGLRGGGTCCFSPYFSSLLEKVSAHPEAEPFRQPRGLPAAGTGWPQAPAPGCCDRAPG